MNFIDFVAYICSVFAISITVGVVVGNVIVSLDEKRKEKKAMEEIKKPLTQYVNTQKTDKQKERERLRQERAEHNARVLRQYKIKE